MNEGTEALNRLEQAARMYCGEYAITTKDLDRGIFEEDAAAIEVIRDKLKAIEIIKEMHDHQVDISKILNDIEESDDYQDFSFNYSSFPEKDYEVLKGILG